MPSITDVTLQDLIGAPRPKVSNNGSSSTLQVTNISFSDGGENGLKAFWSHRSQMLAGINSLLIVSDYTDKTKTANIAKLPNDKSPQQITEIITQHKFVQNSHIVLLHDCNNDKCLLDVAAYFPDKIIVDAANFLSIYNKALPFFSWSISDKDTIIRSGGNCTLVTPAIPLEEVKIHKKTSARKCAKIADECFVVACAGNEWSSPLDFSEINIDVSKLVILDLSGHLAESNANNQQVIKSSWPTVVNLSSLLSASDLFYYSGSNDMFWGALCAMNGRIIASGNNNFISDIDYYGAPVIKVNSSGSCGLKEAVNSYTSSNDSKVWEKKIDDLTRQIPFSFYRHGLSLLSLFANVFS